MRLQLTFCQGPRSHLYSHILTSCFLDTILVPLCTWLYLLALVFLLFLRLGRSSINHERSGTIFRSGFGASGKSRDEVGIDAFTESTPRAQHGKIHKGFTILYYLLLLVQFLMCVLEIVRLSLAHLGIGLLPFTFVALIIAGVLKWMRGLGGRMHGWRWANLGVWTALAVTNSVKVAQEVKEGTGARKGSKYPVVDQVTDVGVMIGVYAALGLLEIALGP